MLRETNAGEEPCSWVGRGTQLHVRGLVLGRDRSGPTLERSNGMEKEGRMRDIPKREKWLTVVAYSSWRRAQGYKERSNEHNINT